MPTRILHITPHMGGGVGRVLRHFTVASRESGLYTHRIVCLDYANEQSLHWSIATEISVDGGMRQNTAGLREAVAAADIVHIHWWNHPLLYDFMDGGDWPPFRAVLWAHVNGHHPPHVIPDSVLDYGDLFVLGTPYSEHVPAIANRSAHWRSQSIRTVFASSGYEHVVTVQPEPHRGFQVGYIGTVDYGKMHSDYLRMHAAVNLPDVNYVVCGGARHAELWREASQLGVADRFDIRGHVTDIGRVLAQLDVFGYPLQPHHYGASEVALVEAMVCGVVPVVLSNGCEREIVSDGSSGIVAEGVEQYTRAIEYLYRNPSIRRRMSAAARTEARRRFHISRTVAPWHRIYRELLTRPQTRHSLGRPVDAGVQGRACQLFLHALGSSGESELFRSSLASADQSIATGLGSLAPVFRGTSNGSLLQYRQFFPSDPGLKILSERMALADTRDVETQGSEENDHDRDATTGHRVPRPFGRFGSAPSTTEAVSRL